MFHIRTFLELHRRYTLQTEEFQDVLSDRELFGAATRSNFPMLTFDFNINAIQEASEEYVYPYAELLNKDIEERTSIDSLYQDYQKSVEKRNQYFDLGIEIFNHHGYSKEQYDDVIYDCDYSRYDAAEALNRKLKILNDELTKEESRHAKIHQAYLLCFGEIENLREKIVQQQNFVAATSINQSFAVNIQVRWPVHIHKRLEAKNTRYYEICVDSLAEMLHIREFLELHHRYNLQTENLQGDLRDRGLFGAATRAKFPMLIFHFDANTIIEASKELVYPTYELLGKYDKEKNKIKSLCKNYQKSVEQRNHYLNMRFEIFNHNNGYNKKQYDDIFFKCDYTRYHAAEALNQKLKILNNELTKEESRHAKIHRAYQLCFGEIQNLREIIDQQQDFVAATKRNYFDQRESN